MSFLEYYCNCALSIMQEFKLPFNLSLQNKHVMFAGVFVVCFIIGLCTLLAGCNPDLDNQCIAYNLVEGTVYDYKFTSDTCRKCKHGKCHDYPCYSAYVKLHYGSNHTCLMETRKNGGSEYSAQSSVEPYDIGEKVHLIKMKGSNSCTVPATGLVTWGAGVAFLTLCGVVLIAWVAYFLLFEYKNGEYSSMEEGPAGESDFPTSHVLNPSAIHGVAAGDNGVNKTAPSAPAYSPLHDNL